MRYHLLAICLLLCQAIPSVADTGTQPVTTTRADEAEQQQHVDAAAKLLQQGKPAEALDGIDKVIAHFEAVRKDKTDVAYCARSPAESLVYLAEAAKNNTATSVYGSAWCDAYFLRGYALIELGRAGEARAALERAVHLAPREAHYRSELAELYARQKNWNEALAAFDASATVAEESVDKERKNAELGRALRGKGFVLVELGKLDEAEAMYRRCLALDPADKKAMNELRYVQSRQQKQP
ncbi:tetratricopeptide repeat protein [Massilia sp. TW-1]|uniref:Tetratricopeptide repeat protein n=1 Tax=Telluria antibiotica TaxID=2717319 RepID=A0ABX0P8Q5_9BURK|nr:tetratricopeptide repeat protein [Telluria antibiotica]NIA52944.1 tetratricopeptide repeat protein [Telluria antibiotica]